MEALAQRSETRKVNLVFPVEVLIKTRSESEQLNVSMSEFVWRLVVEYFQNAEQRKLEKALEDGYKANYEYYAQMNKEWEVADSE